MAFWLCDSLSLCVYDSLSLLYYIDKRDRERERENILDCLLTGSWAIIGTSDRKKKVKLGKFFANKFRVRVKNKVVGLGEGQK